MRVLIEDDLGTVHVARENVSASDIADLIAAAKQVDAEHADDPDWLPAPVIVLTDA